MVFRSRVPRYRQSAWYLIEDAIGRLHEHVSLDESAPLLEAALTLAGTVPDRLRWVISEAIRLWQFSIAERAHEQLGQHRDALDAVASAYIRFCRGDSSSALAVLAAVAEQALDDRVRVYFLLGRSAYILDGSPAAMDVGSAERDLSTATDLLDDSDTFGKRERSSLRGTVALGRGRLALARGEWQVAATHLRNAVEKHRDSRPFVRILLGDALAAAGAEEEARRIWGNAYDDAHPASFHAAAARRRLDPPYR